LPLTGGTGRAIRDGVRRRSLAMRAREIVD
jgi:hypothetical protein